MEEVGSTPTVPKLVTSVSSDSLSLTGAWFDFNTMPLLTTLSFPKLSWVGLAIQIYNNPALKLLETAPVVTVGGLRDLTSVNTVVYSGFIADTGLLRIDGLFAGNPFSISPSPITVTWPWSGFCPARSVSNQMTL